MKGLSELNIANIEALANPEYGSSSITAYCNPLSVNVHCNVACPHCFTIWEPAGRPFGLTDLSSARGCCTCGYCFN